MKGQIHFLARKRERKEEGEEKSSLKPDHYSSIHTHIIAKKSTVSCFQCRPKMRYLDME